MSLTTAATAKGPATVSPSTGEEMHALAECLFPIHRSITGPGVRETLRILQRYAPIEIHEIPSGTPVLDWRVPDEWRCREAWIASSAGQRMVDLERSNLHVVSYSRPVRGRFNWSELEPHLHTIPDRPDWIPYRTGHFDNGWGFCLSHRTYLEMSRDPAGEFEVCIDSDISTGSLTYGEAILPGETEHTFLIWAHLCHPSLANDNLSGISVATFLAKHLAGRARRYTYRVVFAPATIGAITWLALNESELDDLRHGLVLALLGDGGSLTYKKSRRGNASIDLALAHALAAQRQPHTIREFEPFGYDERQFCSPGFDLPVGCLMRTPYGEYHEYHTSADNLDFIQPESLAESLSVVADAIDILESDSKWINRKPKGEPRLGATGLYEAFGTGASGEMAQRAVLWVLNQSDGSRSLLDIATRSGLPFKAVLDAALALQRHELIDRIEEL